MSDSDARTSLHDPITEEWLKSVGFRWDEFPRSGGKHWTLWFGDIEGGGFSSFEDLGVELARGLRPEWGWNCWLRSDCSHKYARFIHLRHVQMCGDVIRLIVALTDMDWRPENHLYGSIRKPEQADYIRATENRPDRAIMNRSHWAEHEKDESQMRPEVREP
jgi:hypothetical protein